MSANNEQSIGSSVQAMADLTREALETQARLASEYVAVARTILSGDSDRSAAGRALLESVQGAAETYLSRVTELSVAYGNDVLTLNDRVARSVLDDVSSAATASKTTAPKSTASKTTASKTTASKTTASKTAAQARTRATGKSRARKAT